MNKNQSTAEVKTPTPPSHPSAEASMAALAVINGLVRKHTCYRSLQHMLTSVTTPTLNPKVKEIGVIADAYDQAQSLRGDKRRAYRG